MHDKPINAIFKRLIAFKDEMTLIVDISSNVNSLAINNRHHIPKAIVLNTSTGMCLHLPDEEWHVIPISIHMIEAHFVCASAK
jgi:hypothetical protein